MLELILDIFIRNRDFVYNLKENDSEDFFQHILLPIDGKQSTNNENPEIISKSSIIIDPLDSVSV